MGKHTVSKNKRKTNALNVSAEALAQFLATARKQALALPIEAKLKQNKTGALEIWRGTLILNLPTQ